MDFSGSILPHADRFLNCAGGFRNYWIVIFASGITLASAPSPDGKHHYALEDGRADPVKT
jgi:hypothetical protein